MYFNTIKQIKERVIFLKGGILYAKVNKTEELSRESEAITHEKQHNFFITDTSRSKCTAHMTAEAGSCGRPHSSSHPGSGPTAGELTAHSQEEHSPGFRVEGRRSFFEPLRVCSSSEC